MRKNSLHESEHNPYVAKTEGKEKHVGKNTTVRLTFVRHSQKAGSADVVNKEVTALSSSELSQKGRKRAKTFGSQNLTERKPSKAYATIFKRTTQTLEEAFAAAGITGVQILEQGNDTYQAYFAFPESTRSPIFMQEYNRVMQEPKTRYLTEHFPGKTYEELTLDEQEETMEYANEFAIEMLLAYGDERPDTETLSPNEEAAKLAHKINRLINLPDFMPEEKEVDLVSAGHKTSTEALLVRVLKKSNGELVRNLQDIGGSLKILDSWDLEIHNDSNGNKMVSFILRREKDPEHPEHFIIDLDKLKNLAEEGRTMLQIDAKKIDSV